MIFAGYGPCRPGGHGEGFAGETVSRRPSRGCNKGLRNKGMYYERYLRGLGGLGLGTLMVYAGFVFNETELRLGFVVPS